jgi:cytoskeleton protein RodZ
VPAIGEMLRDARMRQGLDISDVEARTKIRAKYLRALENEEWGMLPGSTFVKSFLRTYAEELGLDPHLLVEEYRAHHEEPDELELQPFAAPPRQPREPRRYSPGPPPPGVAVALVVIGVLAFLIVLGLSGEDDGGGGDEAATPTTETQPRRPARTEPEPAPPERVVLRVVPDAETYVCLDRGPDTAVFFEGIITDPETFRGRRLRLNLGRRAVEVTANGEPVTIEPSPEPIGLEFTPADTSELPSGERPCA